MGVTTNPCEGTEGEAEKEQHILTMNYQQIGGRETAMTAV